MRISKKQNADVGAKSCTRKFPHRFFFEKVLYIFTDQNLIMRLRLLLSVALTVILYTSCQKEADPSLPPGTPTTVTEDKAFLNTTITNTLNCIKNVRDGQSLQALFRFMALSDGTVGNEVWIEDMLDELELKMGTLELDPNNSKFNFPSYWGTYNWDRTAGVFTKTAATGIFINFPSEPSQILNNVNIKFDTYVDALYQANAENIYLPTRVKMNMTKDNVELVNVDYTGIFSSGNFPSPISVVLALKIAPQNYKITVTRLTNVEFTTKIELFGSDCAAVLDSKVTFLNDDYNNLDIEEDLSKIEGTYTKGAFSIKANWDARAYYLFTDPTTAQVNSTFVCNVFNGTEKIGELRFKDVNNVREVYIYYKDGTSEDVDVYGDRFTDGLKDILRPYFGNDVDSWF
jgi:hypothetical protein